MILFAIDRTGYNRLIQLTKRQVQQLASGILKFPGQMADLIPDQRISKPLTT